eukprot:5756052-Amphidinium_carterae.2
MCPGQPEIGTGPPSHLSAASFQALALFGSATRTMTMALCWKVGGIQDVDRRVRLISENTHIALQRTQSIEEDRQVVVIVQLVDIHLSDSAMSRTECA